MATFHKTFAAALVAAVGLMLPAKATPLPYTSETTCSVAYGDGSTSAECDGYYTNEFTEFRGAEGSNTVFAYAGGGAMVSNARLNHEDGSVYFEPWDVVSAN